MDGTQQFELHQPLRRRKKAFDAFSNTKETGRLPDGWTFNIKFDTSPV